jgi:hypothetical protein
LLTAIACIAIAVLNPAGILGISNVGERFLYPALIIAVLFFDGATPLRRLAGALSSVIVVVLLYILVVTPTGAAVAESPGTAAINQPEARYRLLFWHRPFMFLPQVEAAQAAATSGKAPALAIAFEGSVLLTRGPEPLHSTTDSKPPDSDKSP